MEHNPRQQLTFEEEWKEFFGQRINLERIEKSCLNGRLRGSHVRSIIWRILLKCLPLERDEWCTILMRTRTSYDKLKSQLMANPHDQISNMDPNVSNPLSLGDELLQNPWQQYFADCELRECINRDVERTFPELQYFKSEKIQTMMSDILFIYAKQHPDIAYRQGMHEILAPLIFVLNFDHQAFAHLVEEKSFEKLPPEEMKILCAVNDQKFLENDSFEIFTQLMMMLERWYLAGDEGYIEQCTEISADSGKIINVVPFVSVEHDDPMSELIVKLRSIMNDILAVVDPPLHRHLLKLQILPQIYGIRWLRLLFGREFPIHDLLFVWDAIFAFRPALSLVDYIFVAMLEQIRHLMIDEDYNTTLQYLMRYPPVADVHSLIEFALHIKSPKKFERPRSPNVANFENITVAGIMHPNRGKDSDIRIVMNKSNQTNSSAYPKGIVRDVFENKQQAESKSFVARIVDTISDRNTCEKAVFRSPSHTSHIVTAGSDETVQLLKEQVSCLQSRLNDMDVMADIVKQRLSIVLDQQLPKISGNDDLKELLTQELGSIRSQIGNVRASTGRYSQNTDSGKYSRNMHSFANPAHVVIELGNEVRAQTVKQIPSTDFDPYPGPRRRASRVETEMREIRTRSLAR